MSKVLTRAWSLPPQRNYVAVDRAVSVPMSDRTVLLADHYLPITGRPAATMQCGAALERLSVPTLLGGGWQDLFIEQTVEQYHALSGRGVPVRLLIGPWAHMDATMRGGAPVVESLAWLDHYTDAIQARTYGAVRIWVGAAKDAGGGQWRELPDWPPKGTTPQRWYLGPLGTLTPQPPAASTQTGFRYDPSDPTPSVGGATLSPSAGVRDNQPLEQRADVPPAPRRRGRP